MAKKPSRSPKTPPSQQSLEAYLNEHIRYEHDMLAFAHQQIHEAAPGPGWNLAYEGFCLHARNLAHFLRHDDASRADHYLPGRPKPQPMPKMETLNTFLFHLSSGRTTKPKMTLDDLRPIGDWLDREWARFVNALPLPYRGVLDPSPVCGPRTFKNGVTAHTACSAVTTTTISSPPTGPVLTILTSPPSPTP